MNLSVYAKSYNPNFSVVKNCTELLTKTNNYKTLQHVTKVAKTGAELSEKFGLDESKVEIACYLHDISAIIPKEDYFKVCEDYNIEILEEEKKLPMLLHQKLSKLIAENIFNIEDKEILSSIESHTTLRNKPCDIDMVVFIADKLSWDQEGIPPFFECVSKALSISLESACLEYISYCLNNNMILIPHPMLIEAKEYLEKKHRSI